MILSAIKMLVLFSVCLVKVRNWFQIALDYLDELNVQDNEREQNKDEKITWHREPLVCIGVGGTSHLGCGCMAR